MIKLAGLHEIPSALAALGTLGLITSLASLGILDPSPSTFNRRHLHHYHNSLLYLNHGIYRDPTWSNNRWSNYNTILGILINKHKGSKCRGR
ncbi:hypothetical protein GGR51DRAFT_427694 [Nemania sp. FL0031]|nr:hypothetical protein GGR51DRAFT_427694 [Nemania sp. FL0031]